MMNTENHHACKTLSFVNGCQTLDGFSGALTSSIESSVVILELV